MQAERKYSNFDPLPDADNAAVGSHQAMVFYRRCRKRRLLFFVVLGKAAARRGGSGLRGSALSLEWMRWEAVFRRERRPESLDRFGKEKFL